MTLRLEEEEEEVKMLKPSGKPEGAARRADREDEEAGRHEEELDPRIQASRREGWSARAGWGCLDQGVSRQCVSVCVCRKSWSSSTRPARRSTDWSCSWT